MNKNYKWEEDLRKNKVNCFINYILEEKTSGVTIELIKIEEQGGSFLRA